MLSKDLRAFVDDIKNEAESVVTGAIRHTVKVTTQYAFEHLTARNPVATGYSRWRWNVSIASNVVGATYHVRAGEGSFMGAASVLERDPKAKYPDPKVPHYNQIRWNSRVIISNDAPYIWEIEERHPQKAGFIKMTFREAEELARVTLKTYKPSVSGYEDLY
jgi:hypothetical protein